MEMSSLNFQAAAPGSRGSMREASVLDGSTLANITGCLEKVSWSSTCRAQSSGFRVRARAKTRVRVSVSPHRALLCVASEWSPTNVYLY